MRARVRFAVRRDGVTNCFFQLSYWGAREIKRVCRSPTLSEVLALCDAADICIWYQSVAKELMGGIFVYSPPQSSAGATLISPFQTFAAQQISHAIDQFGIGNRQQHMAFIRNLDDGRTCLSLQPRGSAYRLSLDLLRPRYQTFVSNAIICMEKNRCVIWNLITYDVYY